MIERTLAVVLVALFLVALFVLAFGPGVAVIWCFWHFGADRFQPWLALVLAVVWYGMLEIKIEA